MFISFVSPDLFNLKEGKTSFLALLAGFVFIALKRVRVSVYRGARIEKRMKLPNRPYLGKTMAACLLKVEPVGIVGRHSVSKQALHGHHPQIRIGFAKTRLGPLEYSCDSGVIEKIPKWPFLVPLCEHGNDRRNQFRQDVSASAKPLRGRKKLSFHRDYCFAVLLFLLLQTMRHRKETNCDRQCEIGLITAKNKSW